MTRVGITGHCDLSPTSRLPVRTALSGELAPYARHGRLTGVSCLARGADQLFAGVVLELGGRLEAVLPAPDYRLSQITPDNLEEFDRLLAAARSTRVMGFERSCRQAYLAASSAMLSEIETLIAVWDGRPATRMGSTGDVVAAAHQLGLPTKVVWPAGTVRLTPPPPPHTQPSALSA